MARKGRRRPRPDGVPEDAQLAVEHVEPPRTPPPKPEPPPPPPPPPVDVPYGLIIALAVAIGGVVGGLAEYANFEPSWLAGIAGLVGGMACGATLSRTLTIPPRLQLAILAALFAMGYGFHVWFGPRNLDYLTPVMAGGISLALCVMAERLIPAEGS